MNNLEEQNDTEDSVISSSEDGGSDEGMRGEEMFADLYQKFQLACIYEAC